MRAKTSMLIAAAGAASLCIAPHALGDAAPGTFPDMTFCQLYGLAQYGRVGGTVGLSLATTSWNVGTHPLDWYQSPNSRHPFIGMNLYRHDVAVDRFIQIGQSWLKHGYFALSNTQCGGSCSNTNGTRLGVGCTDTYGAGLNATQSRLGPRYEVNPWSGEWSYTGSMFQTGGPSNTGIRRRLQVKDTDLDLSLNPASNYYAEGYYVCHDDVNVWNSIAWKPVTRSGSPGGTWNFFMSFAGTFPNIGIALDAWSGAIQTEIAEVLPVVEFQSPDGRAVVAAKAIDLGNGRYRYEYAIYNVDIDRQIGSFSVPISAAINPGNAGFHAVFHHDEPWNTVAADKIAINNDPWSVAIGADSITWSTTANPLRWGTMYNFWFEADAAPMTGDAAVGLFRAAPSPRPNSLAASTFIPTLPPVGCDGDADGDGEVNLDDITYIVLRLGTPGPDGDVDSSGLVDLDDITYTVLRLNTCN